MHPSQVPPPASTRTPSPRHKSKIPLSDNSLCPPSISPRLGPRKQNEAAFQNAQLPRAQSHHLAPRPIDCRQNATSASFKHPPSAVNQSISEPRQHPHNRNSLRLPSEPSGPAAPPRKQAFASQPPVPPVRCEDVAWQANRPPSQTNDARRNQGPPDQPRRHSIPSNRATPHSEKPTAHPHKRITDCGAAGETRPPIHHDSSIPPRR
jgi:hypothetical protein